MKNKRNFEDYVIIGIFSLGLYTLLFLFLKLEHWLDVLIFG